MIEIPDNVKPYLKQLRKYHFWLLALLMPLVLVPLAFTADATLIGEIGKRRKEVEGKLNAVTALSSAEAEGFPELGHPQEEWAERLDRTTARMRKQLLAQWEKFWNDQRELRVWPEELRQDFIREITRLKPGQTLAPRFVERYQNTVRQLVRQLPARLDAAEQMESGTELGRGAGRRPVPQPERFDSDLLARHTVSWDAADQSALYATFNWQQPPSTTQILLAQEELWVYGTLCDAIAAANAGATGSHNATIASINELAVGYRAAQTSPTGRGAGQVMRLQTPGGMGGEMDMGMGASMGMGMGMGMDGETAGGPPPNPRFATSGQPLGMMPEEGLGGGFDAPEDSADDPLRNWIYVDAAGRPLTSSELADSPDTKLAHLVPFVVRGRVDQRKLDLLLRTLATWPVPIDVRQVRVNSEGGPESGGMGRRMLPEPRDGEPTGGSVRRYDLPVELRGTIALANPPEPALLGLGDPAESMALADEE